MVPRVVPETVNYFEIAMKERARVQGDMPSAILNFTSETRVRSTVDDDASTDDNGASFSSDDAQVGFRFSAVKEIQYYVHPYLET